MTTVKINPKRLAALRARKGLSQKQLASKVGVDKGSVSRWERGETTRVRDEKLGLLCKVLHTTTAELSADSPLSERSPDRETGSREQVNLMMDIACRNALGLVAMRYGVTRQQIVEIAPLLFFIAAERSLIDRREKLDRLRDRVDRAIGEAADHLQNYLRGTQNWHDEELLEQEDASLAARDLFAKQVGPWTDDRARSNPFARFLTDLLAETGLNPLVPINWEVGEGPTYRIGFEEVSKLVGGDSSACASVLSGKVALTDMPTDVRRGSSAVRAQWVNDQAGIQDRELKEFLETLDLQSFTLDLVETEGDDHGL